MFYTADPARDALEYEDSLELQCEKIAALQAQERTRLSDAFVNAAAWGEEEPLGKESVGLALYAVAMDKPELVEAFFYYAARQTDNPVLRSMVREVGDAWAEIQSRETQA